MSEVTLWQGDCLEYMQGMDAGSVDAVITDPPYGENISAMGFARSGRHGGVAQRNNYLGMASWDEVPIKDTVKLLPSLADACVIFGGNFYADVLPPSRCWLVWDKKDGGKYSNDFADIEIAWTNIDAPARLFRHVWHGMIQQDMKNKDARFHPAQKPVALMRWIIKNYTRPGDTIFDPFMGSGTTGVAAVQLGRNFIGCELDPGYFAIAEKRIAQAQLQPRLFDDEPRKDKARQDNLL